MNTLGISKMVVFGDGLSDLGRWGVLTGNRFPPSPPFYKGRWCNGQIWVEYLAQRLGIELDPEDSYALGGATTGYYNINEQCRASLQLDDKQQITGMLSQVDCYLSSMPKVSDSVLYVLWAGVNDIVGFVESGVPDIDQYPPVNQYKISIDLLRRAGAKRILVLNIPDVSSSGRFKANKASAQMASELSDVHNKSLRMMVTKEHSLGADVVYLDIASIFKQVRSNPEAYGFNYRDEPFLPFDFIDYSRPLALSHALCKNQTLGENPDRFIYWWGDALSSHMQQLVADQAFLLLYEHYNNQPDV